MKRTTVIAILLALVVGVSALANPTVERPAPVEDKGEGIYLVVLGDRGTEPDIAAMGGRLLRSWADRRLVAIPRDAIAALRQHERVRYVQRVWMGENTDAQPIEAQPLAAAVRSEAAPPPWSTGTFTYDPSGNIQSVGDDTYGYDAAGRLTQASVHGQSQTQTQSYAFDAYGNLLGLGDQSFTVSAATNRLMATQIGGTTRGFTYDDAGRLEIDADGRRYQYDGLGMATLIDLPAAEAIDGDMRMIYTADDERIAVAGARTTTYRVRDFGAHVLREWESTDGILEWQRDYIHAGGALVAGEVQIDQRQNGLRHYHTDHLGSIRMVTNGAGELVSRHDYMPFGAEILPTTTEFDNTQKAPRDPRKFTGHERDYFTGSNVNGDALDYMHARYYAPEWGRFLSVDPEMNIPAIMRQPQAWNRYSYVMNNPINRTDPTGRCVWDLCIGEGTALWVAGAALAATTTVWLNTETEDGRTNAQVISSSIVEGVDDLRTGLVSLAHRNKKRPSTADKHAKGEGRLKTDKGGEKADWDPNKDYNKRRPPNKRPDWWPKKGPWPPKFVPVPVPEPPTPTPPKPAPQPPPKDKDKEREPIVLLNRDAQEIYTRYAV